MKEYHLYITGRVQGVGFRYFVRQSAVTISGIYGFVKNLPDGKVEVLAQGEEEDLQKLVALIRKGNGYSRVIEIEPYIREIVSPEFSDFNITF